MVIVEVVKPYNDAELRVGKNPGDLFRTTPGRAAVLVNAGVAKVILDEDPKTEKKPAKVSKK